MSMISYFCGIPGATGQRGPQGPPGATGATGATGQTGDNGSITTFGNLHYNKGINGVNGIPQHIDSNFNLYWYVGGWNKITNIIGPNGDIGATGSIGGTGSTGATGSTGDVGPKGFCRIGNNLNMGRIGLNGTNSTIPIILYPYLYITPSNYPHTLKVSYKIMVNNTSSNQTNYSIFVYNEVGLVTIFNNNISANFIGYQTNMDTIAGLTSSYYYCAWVVSNSSLQLTLDNITLRTIN